MEKNDTITNSKAWLRINEAIAESGLNKNILYDLIKTNDVQSSLIKRRGSTRGIRLINRGSLFDFIESQAA